MFNHMKETLKRCLKSQSGATAVEYSLIAFAMFGAIIPAFLYVASALGVKPSAVTDYFNSP